MLTRGLGVYFKFWKTFDFIRNKFPSINHIRLASPFGNGAIKPMAVLNK